MELVIEEISRTKKLIGRHKFTDCQKIGVGRGYGNHIILSDPHICPEHLTIEQCGEDWIVNDLNSVNGSKLDHSKPLDTNHVIKSGDVISIGKSQLRFLLPSHPVPESIKFSVLESVVDFVRSPVVLALNILLFTVLSGLVFYLNFTGEVIYSKLATSAIGMTLAFSIIPSIYTIFSHLTKHEARLWAHLGISFVIFNLFWVLDFIGTVVKFNLSSQWLNVPVAPVVSAALLFTLFWFNFFIGFHQSSKRRMVFAASFTAVILGSNYLIKVGSTPEFSARPKYDSTLMSPSFLITPPTDVEQFIKAGDSLYTKTAAKAKEKDE